mgnify:CR=1 FL=1
MLAVTMVVGRQWRMGCASADGRGRGYYRDLMARHFGFHASGNYWQRTCCKRLFRLISGHVRQLCNASLMSVTQRKVDRVAIVLIILATHDPASQA